MRHRNSKVVHSEPCPGSIISLLCLHLSLARIFGISLNFQITYKVPISLSQLLLCVIYNRPRRKCSFKSEGRGHVRGESDLAMLFGVETCDVKKKKKKSHAEQGCSGRWLLSIVAAERKVLLQAGDRPGVLLKVSSRSFRNYYFYVKELFKNKQLKNSYYHPLFTEAKIIKWIIF